MKKLGVRLEARGERLRYQPASALTPLLVERLKAHRAALLVLLSQECYPDARSETSETGTAWVIDSQDAIPSMPFGPDGWPVDCIAASGIEPCLNCATLEFGKLVKGTYAACAAIHRRRRGGGAKKPLDYANHRIPMNLDA